MKGGDFLSLPLLDHIISVEAILTCSAETTERFSIAAAKGDMDQAENNKCH
jgi:hypothetical protein